jgi:selenocysteine lyase/cysteine desulfurase
MTDKAQILRLIEEALIPQTRVCSFSHVTTTTGLQLQLRDIAAITRPRGILLVTEPGVGYRLRDS